MRIQYKTILQDSKYTRCSVLRRLVVFLGATVFGHFGGGITFVRRVLSCFCIKTPFWYSLLEEHSLISMWSISLAIFMWLHMFRKQVIPTNSDKNNIDYIQKHLCLLCTVALVIGLVLYVARPCIFAAFVSEPELHSFSEGQQRFFNSIKSWDCELALLLYCTITIGWTGYSFHCWERLKTKLQKKK